MLSTKRVSVRLSEQMITELRIKSEKKGIPMSNLIRLALNLYLYGEDVKE